MKRLFRCKVTLLAAGFFVCGTYSVKAQPPAYPSGTQVSYIRSWDATAPETNPNNLVSRPLRDVKQATQYFDGLGRSLQTVVKQGSFETGGTATDLVSPVVYDEFGREQYKYLPFVANNTGNNTSLSDGGFKLNPFQQQATFMTAQYGSQSETYFYSKSNFEASPLSRVEKTMAPGNSWVGSNRGVEAKYWLNTTTDDVKKWYVTDVANGFGACAVNGYYPAGELFKNVTVDEHGKQVIEFKDKEGKVILKKVQLTAPADNGTGSGYPGWMCTYYIYDDLGNLRCVIQPRGIELLLQNGWILDNSPAGLGAEQCFCYEYDQRNRLIRKKVPGAGEVYMVYDALDRMIMTQDANMRNGTPQKWMITKYDVLNRPVETGLWNNDGNTFAAHLSNAYNNTTGYPNTATGYEILSITHYDDYTGLPAGLSDFLTTWNSYFSATDNQNWPYPQMPQKSTATKGMVTWAQVKVLGTGVFLNTATYYDDKGRAIQVQSTNISGGTDVVTTQYTWAGQPLKIVQRQQKPGVNAQETVAVTQITYDDLGRVSKAEKKISNSLVNGGAMPLAWKTIAQNEYDKLGQLKKKSIGTDPATSTALETENFEYNIRGWLLGMNRDYARDVNSTNYFGFDLGYDKTNNNLIGGQSYTTSQYNGNITGMVWKSKGDGEKRKYDFSYDAANRLMKADFTQYTSGTFNQTSGLNFNVKMGDGATPDYAYDANGNIKQMQQWGWKLGGSVQIDNLAYLYQTNSNKLARVTDANNDPATKLGDFKDGNNAGTDDYNYDVNGNMNVDNNKAISSINYNHLNLPSVITITGKGTITYTYDAAGNKLQKTVNESGQPAKTTLYIAGAVYENDVLQFIGHEEGRIRFKPVAGAVPASLQYDYMLKDHLGNVRMVLTEEQQQNKYPVASLETIKLSIEQQYYNIQTGNIVDANTVTGLPSYTNDNGIGNNPADAAFSAANSQKLYKLNSNTNKTGLGMTLKVMAGDKIDIFGNSYYFQNNTGGTAANSAIPVLDILNGLIGSPNGTVAAAGHGGITGSQLNNLSGTTGGISNLLSQQTTESSGNPNRPKAYINYIFLDEQFKYVTGGFSPVGSNSAIKNHFSELQNLTASKSGYVYIYVSNESPVNVFFDNLQVVHTRGAMLEETHYYPFGLTMAGISSKALNGIAENKFKFNDGTELSNKEFSDGTGLELYETPFRGYDPQIGRFWQIDEMADDYEDWSPYTFSLDNPIFFNDPSGLESNPPKETSTPYKPKELEEVVVKTSYRNKWNYSDWTSFWDRIGSFKTFSKDIINYSIFEKHFIENGVNERGLRLSWLAYQAIDYRKRLAGLKDAAWEIEEEIAKEAALWFTGGKVFQWAGRLIKWGYRQYKVYRKLKAAKTGGRVFWSGGDDVMNAATNYAKNTGQTTLGMTRAGQNLQNLITTKNIPWSEARPMWARLSTVYAKGTKGSAHFFGAENAGSIWMQFEKPVLLNNGVKIIPH